MSCWSLAISDSVISDDVVDDIESPESVLLIRGFLSSIGGEDVVSSSGGVGDRRCLGAMEPRRVATVFLSTFAMAFINDQGVSIVMQCDSGAISISFFRC